MTNMKQTQLEQIIAKEREMLNARRDKDSEINPHIFGFETYLPGSHFRRQIENSRAFDMYFDDFWALQWARANLLGKGCNTYYFRREKEGDFQYNLRCHSPRLRSQTYRCFFDTIDTALIMAKIKPKLIEQMAAFYSWDSELLTYSFLPPPGPNEVERETKRLQLLEKLKGEKQNFEEAYLILRGQGYKRRDLLQKHFDGNVDPYGTGDEKR